MSAQMTVGQELMRLLESFDVDTVFGIPGVHTVELYRGLSGTNIRHVTPRHELDAGFMADGYARASGKPGVCLLITGPGVTNAITAMAQARADSIPILIISGVNALETLGQYRGHLHELPDQKAMVAQIALSSERLEHPQDLPAVVARAFHAMRQGRPGPVHIEIPIDLMGTPFPDLAPTLFPTVVPAVTAPGPSEYLSGEALRDFHAELERAASICAAAQRPLILAGGGAVRADDQLRQLAERLDAVTVTTTNARGILANHPLCVPASPSLTAIRSLIADADLVVAIGTQFGPTDYDVYCDGGFAWPSQLIWINTDPSDTTGSDLAGKDAGAVICADAALAAGQLAGLLEPRDPAGAGTARAATARRDAFAELSPKMQTLVGMLETIRDVIPGCMIVGDSTQAIYAGNLYWEAAFPGSWFNAATGFGALGYGPPAAIGASIARPRSPVVCIVGDGGFQLCLGALGTAADEAANVIFLVWNNHGYQEIENYMLENDIAPVGVRPSAPDFLQVAGAYGIPARRITLTDGDAQTALKPGDPDLTGLGSVLEWAVSRPGPSLIEIIAP